METKDILIFIAGIFVSTIIGYVTQYTSTPLANKFRKWRNNQAQKKASQSIAKAQQRINQLNYEISKREWFLANPVQFTAHALAAIQLSIFRISFAIFLGTVLILVYLSVEITNILPLVVYVFAFLYLVVPSGKSNPLDYFNSVYDFPKYKVEVKKQIAELQKVVDGEKS